jgi:hypothetical protein
VRKEIEDTEIAIYQSADRVRNLWDNNQKTKEEEGCKPRQQYSSSSAALAKSHKLLNHIEILAVLPAKTDSGCISEAKSTQSELKNGISLQTKRTPAKIRRLRLITEIRHMVGNGCSYREIMDTLEIPERSFYRYLSQAFEHDRQLMQEQDKDKLALELSILHDRLTSTYRRLILIAGNENIAAKDRINAEAASCEVALAITKLAFEGPIVLKNFAAYLR